MPSVKDVVIKAPSEEEKEQCSKWPVWTCEASTFDWDYTQSETCLLIEGKVTVTDRPAGAEAVSFGPGDMVIFPVGLKCIWKVSEPVRKYYNFE